MNTLYVLWIGVAAAHFAGTAIAEIKIRDYPPGVAVNGGVVPTEATFTPPLKAGQAVVVDAAGTEALRLEVVEGEVSKLSSRVKMPESGNITYRRIRDGTVQESSVIAVQVKDGVRPAGTASPVMKGGQEFREQAKAGSYRLLVYTENGMGSAIVLHDSGFRVRIVGSNALSNNLFLGVEGGFSDKLTSEFLEP